jgi:hypothetical protein
MLSFHKGCKVTGVTWWAQINFLSYISFSLKDFLDFDVANIHIMSLECCEFLNNKYDERHFRGEQKKYCPIFCNF